MNNMTREMNDKTLEMYHDSNLAPDTPYLENQEAFKNANKAVGQEAKWTANGLNVAQTFGNLWDAYSGLTNEDSSYTPDYAPLGSPMIPSSCARADSGCYRCYQQAVKDINFTRFYLEKMRGIVRAEIDRTNKAKAFGDSASNIHGVSGLAWQLSGKPQIEEAVIKLRHTYTRKYNEYMEPLHSALQELSMCENTHFDNPDWFARFGFMYYSFIEEKYRSPD